MQAAPSAMGRPHSLRHSALSWLGLAPLVIASILILAPVVWAASTSLRTPAESFTLPPQWIPIHPDWSNYGAIFQQIPYGRYVLNSLIVCAGVVVGQLFTAALAGYAFARLPFPGKGILFWLILATLMIPLQATIIPVFVLITKMHLQDTLTALILPALPTAFGTFLMRQYFLGLSNELEEAAVIDGANQWEVFWRIYLPLGLPGLAILAMLTFNGTWNDFFRPLIFLTSQHNFTVPLGVVTLFGYLGTGSVSVVLAAVCLSLAIVLVVYIFGQRYLIEGITVGSVKG
jgi:multiple sugar transport system permease protein